MEKTKFGLEWIDVEIGISIALCLLLAVFWKNLQTLSACTAVLLCVQKNGPVSWKTGMTRMLITLMGGLSAMMVVFLDNAAGNNRFLFPCMAFFGILATFLLCKAVHVPYISCRIGCVTFVLVVLVAREGPAAGRYLYCLNRLIGTFAGVLIAFLVSWAFSRMQGGEPANRGNAEGTGGGR